MDNQRQFDEKNPLHDSQYAFWGMMLLWAWYLRMGWTNSKDEGEVVWNFKHLMSDLGFSKSWLSDL